MNEEDPERDREEEEEEEEGLFKADAVNEEEEEEEEEGLWRCGTGFARRCSLSFLF